MNKNTFSGIAHDKLAALEEKARAGESVEATDFAAATAAVRIEQLAAEGEAGRLAEEKRAAEVERRDAGVAAVRAELVPAIDAILAGLDEAVSEVGEAAPDLLLSGNKLCFPVYDARNAATRLLNDLGTDRERDHVRDIVGSLQWTLEEAAGQWVDHVDVAELSADIRAVGELLAKL